MLSVPFRYVRFRTSNFHSFPKLAARTIKFSSKWRFAKFSFYCCFIKCLLISLWQIRPLWFQLMATIFNWFDSEYHCYSKFIISKPYYIYTMYINRKVILIHEHWLYSVTLFRICCLIHNLIHRFSCFKKLNS